MNRPPSSSDHGDGFIPRSGQTLLGMTRRVAAPIHRVHQRVKSLLKSRVSETDCSHLYKQLYLFHNGLDNEGQTHIYSLASAALIMNWLAGRLCTALPAEATLKDAEYWYLGEFHTALSSMITAFEHDELLKELIKIDIDLNLKSILPFATEVFETDAEIITDRGRNRKKKKTSGIFYTPDDVSSYVISEMMLTEPGLLESIEDKTWLDPACGTGSFLLMVSKIIPKILELRDGAEKLDFVLNSIYGIDTSPIAIQTASYLLALQATQDKLRSWKPRPCDAVSQIQRNFFVGDALRMEGTSKLESLFSRLISGADFVLSNPPYITGKRGNYSLSSKSAASLVPGFVRLMSSLSNKTTGVGGMIVPLSVTYSTRREFKDLRKFIWNRDDWSLLNFDRTPDSLFGDDVKTRNSIVFFRRTNRESEINSSDLVRWNSRSRNSLFSELKTAKVPVAFRSTLIPKCGSTFGFDILKRMYSRQAFVLGKTLSRANIGKSVSDHPGIRNSPTAYNWLTFEICTGDDPQTVERSKYHYWYVHEDASVFATFAILQSRMVYWLWRIWGDGFHLNDEFIRDIPISEMNMSHPSRHKLEECGRALWKQMLESPIISLNSGVSSVSYCPYLCDNLLDEIDNIISIEMGLPCSVSVFLKGIVQETIVAGRQGEIRTNPALRKWMMKESKKNDQDFVGN
jgi:N-6 DNA Methylase